jgi:hypothetical protein
VRSKTIQVERLRAWAANWPDRAWAVKRATGLDYLRSQQLVDAGEAVIDLQPKLAAKVRLLDTGSTNKNPTMPLDRRRGAAGRWDCRWCGGRTM